MDFEASEASFRRWMTGHLVRAATYFGVRLVAQPVFGWRLRSASAPTTGDGWLRVGSEYAGHIDEGGEFWTGNVDANAVPAAVSKPRVLAWADWAVGAGDRRVRAELMTRLPGHPCSDSEILRAPLTAPDTWWAGLRATLDTLRTVPTERHASSSAVKTRYRDLLGGDVEVTEWETGHGDLHWNNLLGPEFGLLDWEMWGRLPAGTDAASLYCRALLVPDTARRVRDVFGDVLDSPAGRTAQLLCAANLITRGEFPDLEPVLYALISTLGEHLD